MTNDVDLTHCEKTCDNNNCGSGRGYVFLNHNTGAVSAVVVGGSNQEGWWHHDDDDDLTANSTKLADNVPLVQKLNSIVRNQDAIMLQREVPEYVNLAIANAAKQQWNDDNNNDNNKHNNVVIVQDVGGEDREISDEMLQLCDFIIPNLSELKRLMPCSSSTSFNWNKDDNNIHEDEIVRAARHLQKSRGGTNVNVLVTLGSRGSILIPSIASCDNIVYQPVCSLPPNTQVVDETGAGDCYRAAFVAALVEQQQQGRCYSLPLLRECMEFASAAGALAVTKMGAVPSIPTRNDVEQLLAFQKNENAKNENTENSNINTKSTAVPPTQRGGGMLFPDDPNNTLDHPHEEEECPLLFGSRLNSMKDRPDLYNNKNDDNADITTVQAWVQRQGTIRGLNCVDFNYPQHFTQWTAQEAKLALEEANLVPGAVCLRYPHDQFQQGAMTHPDPSIRTQAIETTKAAAQIARQLGCEEVCVWSAYCGYDYPLQADYTTKWNQIVQAFQQCCDAYPDIRFSLEFKPTDENTRFFIVPNTAAAILLVEDVNRPNMGLTLDVGHMLMAGENPGQSIAMVSSRLPNKLFGIQLNDGYTRLAAEDGMMFGSVHPHMALEVLYRLQKCRYKGHLYFDTFPQRTDPVLEAEYNIRRVKMFWNAASRLDGLGQEEVLAKQDALGSLEIMDEALAAAARSVGSSRCSSKERCEEGKEAALHAAEVNHHVMEQQ